MLITVVIPTHNPNRLRLKRTLMGIAAQTWPVAQREVLLIDNASKVPLQSADFADELPDVTVLREDRLGLTAARIRGFEAAQGDLIVLVDDDNELAVTYLAAAAQALGSDPQLGAVGGRSLPDFESPPPAWSREFDGLLALRDPGSVPERAQWLAGVPQSYPPCAPIGAGMVLRREAAAAYLKALELHPQRRGLDRTGNRLISGGDNDLVMSALEAGWAVAYRPELSLLHLIPAHRSETKYLGELNRAVARSWVSVLAMHGIRLWPPISAATVPLRRARAWLRTGAWRGPAAWVRWQGLSGVFEGQADLTSFPP